MLLFHKFTLAGASVLTRKSPMKLSFARSISPIGATRKKLAHALFPVLTATLTAVCWVSATAQPVPTAPSAWELQYLDCVRRANARAGIKLTPTQEQTMLETARDEWSIAPASTSSAKSSNPKKTPNPLADVNKRYGCRI